MKIILSPAKKMKVDSDSLPPLQLPAYLDKTRELMTWLQHKNFTELKTLWKCSDSIAVENMKRLEEMNLTSNLTPAVLAYEGIAYQYMAPAVFANEHFQYIEDHLRILSGFYGILKPMDGVVPYRLEMQARGEINGIKNLYDYWGNSLYEALGDQVIINLASKEYSKCIEKYLTKADKYITIDFCEMHKGKLVTKGTYAKMARGEMVRFMAENAIEEPEKIQKFDRLGYKFREDLSDNNKYVFERAGK